MNLLSLKAKLEIFPYYTKQNLSLCLDKKKENLNYWIKKLLRQKILIALKKGFYISSFYLDKVKEQKQNERYLEYLAGVLRYPSYISLEYALAKYGLIPESVFRITAITPKTTRIYKSDLTTFTYQSIKTNLYTGYIEEKFGKNLYRIATPSKALFDYLYLKKFTDDNDMKDFLLDKGRLNWKALNIKEKQSFYKYIDLSLSKKMKKILSILKINKIL